MLKRWIVGMGVVMLVAVAGCKEEKETDYHETLPTSLHGTSRGMEYWYQQGTFNLTNISYQDLSCKNCHTEDCSSCHDVDQSGEPVLGGKEENAATCYQCHGRQKAMQMKIMPAKNEEDVHFAMNFKCGDCHSGEDIHGDGTQHDTFLSPNFFDAKCENCHNVSELPQNAEHNMHAGNFKCSVCHMKRALACYNCHFNAETEHDKKVPYMPVTDFILLVRDLEGKISPGTIMSLDYVTDSETKTLLAIAPYYSHTITSAGRHCTDCHNNEAVQEYNATGKVRFTWWNSDSNTLEWKTGVIPYAEKGALEIVFLKPLDPHAEPTCSEQGCSYPEWVTVGTDITFEHDIAQPLGAESMEHLSH